MKRNWLHILLIFAGLTTACSQKAEKPKGLVPADSLALMLADIYQYESEIYFMSLDRDSAKQVFQIIKPVLFAKRAMDSTRFNRSFSYYVQHPKVLAEIYDVTIDTLMRRKTEFEIAKKRAKAVKDSLAVVEARKKVIADSLARLDSLKMDSLGIDSLKVSRLSADSLRNIKLDSALNKALSPEL